MPAKGQKATPKQLAALKKGREKMCANTRKVVKAKPKKRIIVTLKAK